MKKIIICILTVMCMVFSGVTGFAQYNKEEMKEDALISIDLAQEFSNRGQTILKSPSRDNFKIAAYLYQEAGMLYEQANRIFLALEDKGAAAATRRSVKTCIDTIKKCNEQASKRKKRY